MLRQQTSLNINEPKISIYDIHTSQWSFYCLTFKCDIDLQLSLTNDSNEQLCQMILKYRHKYRNLAPTSWIYDHFIIWPSSTTLTFNLPKQVSNEQLCQIILKSMQKCRSCGPNKLNLWSFYHLTSKCELDQQPTWANASNGTSTHQGKQTCQIILKFMHKSRNYGPDELN